MSVFSFLASLVSKADTGLVTLKATFATVDNATGVVLGLVEVAGTAIAVTNPALGASVVAGAAAATTLRATLEAGFAAASPSVVTLTSDVAQLSAHIVTLTAQVAPFFTALAKEAGAVDQAAVAAVAALPKAP